MLDTSSELARIRAELAALQAHAAAEAARVNAAESELTRVRAVVSCSEAMIQELKLEIAKLRRDKYGISSERRARLIDQLELQLEDLEATAAEDALAAEQSAAEGVTTTVKAFARRKSRKPRQFPEHLPRERVVVEAPTACTCCGSDRIVKSHCEDGRRPHRNTGSDPATVESYPDRAREVHLPDLREDQSTTSPIPCHSAWMGRPQSYSDDRL